MEELKAEAARKLGVLLQLAVKLKNKYGEDWETKPHPECPVTVVYNNLLKKVNGIADELEKK